MNGLNALLESDDPTIRYKVRVNVLGESARLKKNRALRDEIPRTPRAVQLLSDRTRNGETRRGPYAKWDGAHWILYGLALLDYPPGDDALVPLREQVLKWLLSESHVKSIRHANGIPHLHASMESNAVWSLHTLGLADERVNKLVDRLVETQWADGGWNCDIRSTGKTSSFHESLMPLRALALHSKITGDRRARAAAERCAEFFLKRQLFKRATNGQIIHPSFVLLHFPCYWHYDFLSGLEAIWRAGRLSDPRRAEALDLLESKSLPDGGWPAEKKFYQHTGRPIATGRSLIEWGPTGTKTRNDFVTADAFAILRAAGRINGNA